MPMQAIRVAEYDELQEVSDLMRDIFMRDMASEYSDEGHDALLHHISLSALEKRFLAGNQFYVNEKISAVLEIESPSHIAFLMVKEQHAGWGARLLEHVYTAYPAAFYTVGAFPLSQPFYEKMGFVPFDTPRQVHGMPFTLMVKV
jgi:GNAT superfamily N-acetyltransferase